MLLLDQAAGSVRPPSQSATWNQGASTVLLEAGKCISAAASTLKTLTYDLGYVYGKPVYGKTLCDY